MFKRRRSADEGSEPKYASDSVARDLDEVTDEEVTEITTLEDADAEADDAAEERDDAAAAREGGPFDESDVDDDLQRLDLGALRVLPVESVEVRLEVDEQSGVVQAVTLVHESTALQVGVFAAPRTEGIWEEVRTQISASISSSGGTVDEVDGPFGPELRAKVQAEDEQGRNVLQSVRFVGVDGPRWFLRGLLSGKDPHDDTVAAPLLETFRGIVVVRGSDPMAPHEPLPIHLPVEAVEGDDAPPEAAGHELNPFRRGPEITEIR